MLPETQLPFDAGPSVFGTRRHFVLYTLNAMRSIKVPHAGRPPEAAQCGVRSGLPRVRQLPCAHDFPVAKNGLDWLNRLFADYFK